MSVSPPEGYAKSKPSKKERPPMRRAGQPTNCNVCHRVGRGIVDTICKRCLKDRYELGQLEQEIAVVYPATAKLTSPQIFRKLWVSDQRLRAEVKKLKSQVSTLGSQVSNMNRSRREDHDDLVGRPELLRTHPLARRQP
jgi:hypothetical protein